MSWPGPAASAYRDLLHQLDAWFTDVRASHPDIIPCQAGCSACCHGPFDISVADVVLIREGFVRLPPEERSAVLELARRQVHLMTQLEPGWNQSLGITGLTEEGFDQLGEAMAEEPCPFLDPAGDCRIYDERPMVCRLIGLGITTPAGRVIENSCPIQDQFPAYAALPPMSLDLEALEETEIACLEAASVELFGTPLWSGFETTIALAITGMDSDGE